MSASEIYLDTLVAMALEEDIGTGDLTANWFVPEADTATARIIAKQAGVLAGVEAARKVFLQWMNASSGWNVNRTALGLALEILPSWSKAPHARCSQRNVRLSIFSRDSLASLP